MKKLICLAASVVLALTAFTQELKFDPRRDSIRRDAGFVLPDTLAHFSPWKPEFKPFGAKKASPVVTMTSVIVIPGTLPSRVTVINNNTLRLGQKFNLSNGQAWNWSPFPDAYLDARTLSFPMPR